MRAILRTRRTPTSLSASSRTEAIRKEIQSTINYGKAYPAIDREYFGTKSYALEGRDNWQFWSSMAWYTVDVDIGLIADLSPSSTYWVRAVRTLPPEYER